MNPFFCFLSRSAESLGALLLRGRRSLSIWMAVALLLPALVFADALGDAKAKGLVGEQADGYLGVVAAGNSDAAAIVADINGKRRAEYERLAAANQISVSDVEKLAGKKAIEKTPPGQYVRMPGSDWQKK